MGYSCTLPLHPSQVEREILRIHASIKINPNVIAHARAGSNLWYVYRNPPGEPYAGIPRLALLLVEVHREPGNQRTVCYKGMDESAGPYQYTAPARLVRMCPPPPDGHGWREEWERRRSTAKTVTKNRPWEAWVIGTRITNGRDTWTYQGPCPNRRLGIRITDDAGGRFRLPLSRCRRLSVVAAPAAVAA